MPHPANSQIHTELFRYPLVFGYAYYLHAMGFLPRVPRILSFGCSTGEELLSLRHYFPTAHLLGCDVHLDAMHLARQATASDPRTTVFESTASNLHRHGPFDAIFANSVLCVNTPNAATVRRDLPFSRFEDLLCEVAGHLAPEGVMFIVNPSYQPDHSQEFRRIARPVRSHFVPMGYVPRYTRDGEPMLGRRVVDGKGFYVVEDGIDPATLAHVANSVYTRGEELRSFRIDYSGFSHHQQLQLTPPPDGRMIETMTMSHHTAGMNGRTTWPSQENLGDFIHGFLPEVFVRIPGVSDDLVSLA